MNTQAALTWTAEKGCAVPQEGVSGTCWGCWAKHNLLVILLEFLAAHRLWWSPREKAGLACPEFCRSCKCCSYGTLTPLLPWWPAKHTSDITHYREFLFLQFKRPWKWLYNLPTKPFLPRSLLHFQIKFWNTLEKLVYYCAMLCFNQTLLSGWINTELTLNFNQICLQSKRSVWRKKLVKMPLKQLAQQYLIKLGFWDLFCVQVTTYL